MWSKGWDTVWSRGTRGLETEKPKSLWIREKTCKTWSIHYKDFVLQISYLLIAHSYLNQHI